MKKNINDLLPEKDKVFVQAKIPTELYNKVKNVMIKKNYTWPDVMKASLRRFLDEVQTHKKQRKYSESIRERN